MCSPADAASVAVRFPEGLGHGFLRERSRAGEIIGQGEMTQVVKDGDQVESHLVFTFKDGSLHDEKVIFSQQGVFRVLHYRLAQHGPSFPDQIEVSIDRSTAEYKGCSTAGADGKEEVRLDRLLCPRMCTRRQEDSCTLTLAKLFLDQYGGRSGLQWCRR